MEPPSNHPIPLPLLVVHWRPDRCSAGRAQHLSATRHSTQQPPRQPVLYCGWRSAVSLSFSLFDSPHFYFYVSMFLGKLKLAWWTDGVGVLLDPWIFIYIFLSNFCLAFPSPKSRRNFLFLKVFGHDLFSSVWFIALFFFTSLVLLLTSVRVVKCASEEI